MKLRFPLVALALLAFVPAAQAAHFRDKISGKTLRVWGFKASADCHALPVGTVQPGEFRSGRRFAGSTTRTPVRLGGRPSSSLTSRSWSGGARRPNAPVSQLTFLRGKHARGGTRIKLTAYVSGYAVFDRPYTTTGGSLRRGWPQANQGAGGGAPNYRWLG